MTEEELATALEGLFAYDDGSTQIGTHDPALKARCVTYLDSLPDDESRALLARIARELWLSDDAIEVGYGLEDAAEFARWIYDDNFGL